MKGFLGEGGEWGCIVSIVARTTEESWFRVLAGFKFFLQTVQMDWGPPSLLLCGYGKFKWSEVEADHSPHSTPSLPIHIYRMNGTNCTLTIANDCISHYCK